MEGVGPFNAFVKCPLCGKYHTYVIAMGMKVVACPTWGYGPMLWDEKKWRL